MALGFDFGTKKPRAPPQCSEHSALDRPPPTSANLHQMRKDLQRPCRHQLRTRMSSHRLLGTGSLGTYNMGVRAACDAERPAGSAITYRPACTIALDRSGVGSYSMG